MLRKTLATSAILIGGLTSYAAALDASESQRSTADEYADAATEKATQHAADQADSMKSATFSQLDTNGDGYLSQTELQEAPTDLSANHDTLDSNQDGQVDQTEFAAFERMTGAQPAQGDKPMTDMPQTDQAPEADH